MQGDRQRICSRASNLICSPARGVPSLYSTESPAEALAVDMSEMSTTINVSMKRCIALIPAGPGLTPLNTQPTQNHLAPFVHILTTENCTMIFELAK